MTQPANDTSGIPPEVLERIKAEYAQELGQMAPPQAPATESIADGLRAETADETSPDGAELLGDVLALDYDQRADLMEVLAPLQTKLSELEGLVDEKGEVQDMSKLPGVYRMAGQIEKCLAGIAVDHDQFIAWSRSHTLPELMELFRYAMGSLSVGKG